MSEKKPIIDQETMKLCQGLVIDKLFSSDLIDEEQYRKACFLFDIPINDEIC